MGYDVLTRPSGGKIAFAFCDDGKGHCFHVGADGAANRVPACGRRVRVRRPGRDRDEFCESCSLAAKEWAAGGELKVVS